MCDADRHIWYPPRQIQYNPRIDERTLHGLGRISKLGAITRQTARMWRGQIASAAASTTVPRAVVTNSRWDPGHPLLYAAEVTAILRHNFQGTTHRYNYYVLA